MRLILLSSLREGVATVSAERDALPELLTPPLLCPHHTHGNWQHWQQLRAGKSAAHAAVLPGSMPLVGTCVLLMKTPESTALCPIR